MLPYATDAEKWRALVARDASADGVFVYAVRTTRIYCRPNCKARLARRANVLFFTDTPAAEAAGFRACKRCKPTAVGGMPEDAAVARIRSLVAAGIDATAVSNVAAQSGTDGAGGADGGKEGRTAKAGAASLASQASVSRWHFHRKFKEVTGLTPRAYMMQRDRVQGERERIREMDVAESGEDKRTKASAPASESESRSALPSTASEPALALPTDSAGLLDWDTLFYQLQDATPDALRVGRIGMEDTDTAGFDATAFESDAYYNLADLDPFADPFAIDLELGVRWPTPEMDVDVDMGRGNQVGRNHEFG